MDSDVCCERSLNGRRYSASFGQFADTEIVSVQGNLDRARIREGPIAQTSTQTEGDASAICRIEFAIAKTCRIRTCIDVGSQQLPLCVVHAKIGGIQLSSQMRC